MKQKMQLIIKLIMIPLVLAQLLVNQGHAAALELTNVPLFLINNGKPNILMMLGNANSMDEDATGQAVGSAAFTSKSEIARNAMETLITDNAGKVNIGLIAYQQNPASLYYLHTSQYDVSYNPADYDPNFNGARNSQTKKFRVPNPTSPGEFIYYNVSLPFYAPSNSGNDFCYSRKACTSPSHDFKGKNGNCNNPEDPVSGPWDKYYCFNNKTGISNVAANNQNGGAAQGYTNNKYNPTFGPTTSDLGQGITDFGKLVTSQYVSATWFNNQSPGGGFIHVPLAPLDSLQATNLLAKLKVSDPATDSNSPTDPTKPLQNSGLSPLEGTLITANNYYNNNPLPSAQTSGPVGPVPGSCDKNFVVLLTDGLPSVDQNGNPSADVEANLAAAVTQAQNLLNSPAKVKTFVVGFALPFGVNPNQLDTIAAAGGTGSAYYADDPVSLEAAFNVIFENIATQATGASASVAANSSALKVGTKIYQSKFDASDWTGDLLSINVNTSGELGSPIWSAATQLNAQLPNNRTILTYKPSTNKGIAFRWPADEANPLDTELDISQTTALHLNATDVVDNQGAARLDYLRGSAVNEGFLGLEFRERALTKLGDIVNSAPIYVGPPSANSTTDDTYIAFKSAKAGRKPIVYVGANDGMLHGFEAATGNEVLGYVPAAVYSNLSKLTGKNYSHRYFVDSSPSVADVFWGTSWKTMLVSSMGHGARGVFGLNITNPNGFKETRAANIVRFEYPKLSTNATQAAEVGFISGQIPIAKLNNGEWGAVFGNGYNSIGSGKASLFLLKIQNGNAFKRISTGVGNATTPNGLANPVLVDVDGNHTADIAYAGDLRGNLWKFDLSSTNQGDWSRAYKLFAAGEPITQTPQVSKHPNGGYMVYFGTGKYNEASDLSTTNTNTFYGIWDNFNSTVSTADLVQQSVTSTIAESGNTYRLVSQNPVDYNNSTPKKGWYLQLPTAGERSVSNALLRGNKIIFTTLVPTSDACSAGGTSWLMELDYLSGGMLSFQAIDTNGDSLIDITDTIVGGLSSNTINFSPLILQGAPTSNGPGGGSPSVKSEVKYINQSNGVVNKVNESASGAASRRSSWRQIISD